MIGWIFFNVILPLLGIVLIWTGLWLIGAKKKFRSLVRDGQLCFFSTALCAGGIHDFLPINKEYHDLVIGFLLSLIVVFDFFYGLAVVADEIPPARQEDFERRMGIISACSVVVCSAIIVVVRSHWDMWSPV